MNGLQSPGIRTEKPEDIEGVDRFIFSPRTVPIGHNEQDFRLNADAAGVVCLAKDQRAMRNGT